MPELVDNHAIREAAYHIWESDGCPEGRALMHWLRVKAVIQGDDDQLLDETEKRADLPADLPAVLTKDARGG